MRSLTVLQSQVGDTGRREKGRRLQWLWGGPGGKEMEKERGKGGQRKRGREREERGEEKGRREGGRQSV